jgi:hypothetical protein
MAIRGLAKCQIRIIVTGTGRMRKNDRDHNGTSTGLDVAELRPGGMKKKIQGPGPRSGPKNFGPDRSITD